MVNWWQVFHIISLICILDVVYITHTDRMCVVVRAPAVQKRFHHHHHHHIHVFSYTIHQEAPSRCTPSMTMRSAWPHSTSHLFWCQSKVYIRTYLTFPGYSSFFLERRCATSAIRSSEVSPVRFICTKVPFHPFFLSHFHYYFMNLIVQ